MFKSTGTRRPLLFLTSALSTVFMSSVPSYAALELEEIIVTAQKREQSLMDIPISVTAISARAMEANVVRDVFDLRPLVPSLEARTVDPPSQGTSFALRGLGTTVFNMGLEPSVSTFVDGVYRSRSGLLSASNLMDIERVEVLKGPQGTLFGKNSTAGVVSFITKKPALGETSGFVDASYNSWEQVNIGGVVNIPLGQKIAVRFSANIQKGDGWLKEVNSGKNYNNRDRFSVRGQVYFEPNDALDIRISADYAEIDERGNVPARLVNDPNTSSINGPMAAAAGTTLIDPANPYNYEVSTNIVNSYNAKDFGINAEVNYDFSDVQLTWITAYRDFEDSLFKDNDFTAVDILLNRDTLPQVSLFSQELRLAGQVKGDVNINWVVGAFYSEEKVKRTREFSWGSQISAFPFGGTAGRAFYHEFEQDGETFAAFAHLTADLSERLTLTGGLRYTSDKKKANMVSDVPLTNLFGLPNAFPLPLTHDFAAESKDEAISGTASIQYDLTDNVMSYLTYSRGFKAGGISLARDAAGNAAIFTPLGPVFGLPASDPTFDKETANHFEFGVKTSFENGHMEAAAWSTKFDDLQQQVLQADGSFSVVNVTGAISKGFEVSGAYSVSEYLNINISLQYVDAEFSEGVGSITSGGQVLDGTPLPFVSDLTASIGADFSMPLANDGMELFANGNLFFRGDQVLDEHQAITEDGYMLLNLRAGIRFLEGQAEVSIWCRNCTNTGYTTSNFSIPFDGAVLGHSTRWGHLGAPRVVGAGVRYNF